MKVDLGCGSQKLPDHVGVDIAPLEGVDYVVDVRSGMPFVDGEVDLIYTSHFLEHLTGPESLEVLKECYRVLKKDGIIEVNVPDLIWCMEEFLRTPEEERWKFPAARIFGLQDGPGEYHKQGFSRERLHKMLTVAGFDVQGLVPIWSHSCRSILAKGVKRA